VSLRVLAVGADPADLIAACGGTLAGYADNGVDVTAALVGRPATDPGVERAFATLGARVTFAAAPRVADERPARDALMDVLRQARPDVILGPAPRSTRARERRLATLVFGAAYCSCVPNYPSPAGVEASPVRAAILHMDPALSFASGTPQYVDIGAAWERKLAALEALADGDGRDPDPRYVAETLARARGVQVQTEFAEAFGMEPTWGRLRTRRLLPPLHREEG
jgi:LmbE family N-acetylglucosaminyl deacetylase